jgi:hypothetical protein
VKGGEMMTNLADILLAKNAQNVEILSLSSKSMKNSNSHSSFLDIMSKSQEKFRTFSQNQSKDYHSYRENVPTSVSTRPTMTLNTNSKKDESMDVKSSPAKDFGESNYRKRISGDQRPERKEDSVSENNSAGEDLKKKVDQSEDTQKLRNEKLVEEGHQSSDKVTVKEVHRVEGDIHDETESLSTITEDEAISLVTMLF